MSLSFIYAFQSKLYEVIKNNEIINSVINGVFISTQRDEKYPFILINILKITNLMNFAVENYEVDFQICIFSKEKTQDLLFKIISEISEILVEENLSLENYKVIAINHNITELIRGQEFSATKTIINYKALIQGV